MAPTRLKTNRMIMCMTMSAIPVTQMGRGQGVRDDHLGRRKIGRGPASEEI
jgi:hypothetical protein